MKQKFVAAFLVLFLLSFGTANAYAAIQNADTTAEPEVVFMNSQDGVRAVLLSRTEINNCQAKVGDKFNAKLIEDVKVGEKTLLPSGCLINGTIEKVCCPKRLPCRDGEVHISINSISCPDGKVIDISATEISTAIYSPNRRTMTQRVKRRLPMQIASYAVSIPLMATDLAGVAAGAIAMGAAVTTGAVAGYVDPDDGQSREESAMTRCIEATPVGTAKMVLYKGEDVRLNNGEGLSIALDTAAINYIIKERNLGFRVVEKTPEKKKMLYFF